MDKSSLGDRMKGYERVTQGVLTRRMPAILRVDGRAFHTYTKRMKYSFPFDYGLSNTMEHTAAALMNTIQGSRLAYVQSDEISVLLIDYENHETGAWFDNNVQKMCSIAAATASNAFNRYTLALRPRNPMHIPWAQFDARVFNLPREEVCNYFVWRQQDATRNSISMLAQSEFSHRELQGITCSKMQDKLMLEKEINWNDIDTWKKRGFCIRAGIGACFPDRQIPIFTQDREYVEDYVNYSKIEADDRFAAKTKSCS